MPDPLRTLIVDDEPLAVERLQILAKTIPALSVVGTAHDGNAALAAIASLKPDLLLCDIAMPGLDGIALAARLADLPNAPAVIFTTAFDRYAVAAFEVSAVDYLLKPVSAARLATAVGKAQDASRAPARRAPSAWLTEFWVQHRADMLRIAVGDVDLIEAERDYMRLHVGTRSWLIHHTAKSLEQKLDPLQFIRIHRSKIIRRDAIRALNHLGEGAWSVDIGDGQTHRIGRTYLSEVKAIMHRI